MPSGSSPSPSSTPPHGVDDATLVAFLDHGFTRQNALEVVLGVGTYTLSTFANRLTRAPADPQLTAAVSS